MPFSNDRADHVYVSGVGFVSGRDPLHFVERDLHRSSAAVGLCLLLLLALPAIILWPVEIFDAVNSALITAFFGSGALASVAELFRETRELVIILLTWGITYLLLKSMLHPPVPKPNGTLGVKRAIACALLITAGMTSLDIGGTAVLQDIMEFFHLVEMNPGNPPPARPLAIAVYLVRIILVPALFEEVVFRGCILQALRRHGDSFALFFSAFAGGLIHYTFTGNLAGFVLGLVFGYFFLRTGSLKTVVVCHILALTMPVIFQTLQGLLQPDIFHLLCTAALILLSAAGLAGFVLFCRWNHNAFALNDSHGGLSFRRKLKICLTGTPMLVAAVLWLVQVLRNLQVIS